MQKLKEQFKVSGSLPKSSPARLGLYNHQENTPTIFAAPVEASRYIVNITDDVNLAHFYDEVVALLATATENDEIVFNICSYGGYVDTLNMLLGWKSMCVAKQTHVLMGNASSAASALFLSPADEYIVGDGASFMIHEFQCGSGGTESNSYIQSVFNRKRNHEFVRETYRGFLTEDEIENKILQGLEIYLTAPEIQERLETRASLLVAQQQLEASVEMDLSAFGLDELEGAISRYKKHLKALKKEINSRKVK